MTKQNGDSISIGYPQKSSIQPASSFAKHSWWYSSSPVDDSNGWFQYLFFRWYYKSVELLMTKQNGDSIIMVSPKRLAISPPLHWPTTLGDTQVLHWMIWVVQICWWLDQRPLSFPHTCRGCRPQSAHSWMHSYSFSQHSFTQYLAVLWTTLDNDEFQRALRIIADGMISSTTSSPVLFCEADQNNWNSNCSFHSTLARRLRNNSPTSTLPSEI